MGGPDAAAKTVEQGIPRFIANHLIQQLRPKSCLVPVLINARRGSYRALGLQRTVSRIDRFRGSVDDYVDLVPGDD